MRLRKRVPTSRRPVGEPGRTESRGRTVCGEHACAAVPNCMWRACLCGRVEYEVRDPEALGYCHCTRCQRWTGSSLAGVVVAKENFRFTEGEELVTRYESEFAPATSQHLRLQPL